MFDMRRTLLERARAIFNIINSQTKPFPKSILTEAKINPMTAENWLDLIVFIQSQPKIRVIKTDNNVIVEKVDN